jgi:hypothetical protein
MELDLLEKQQLEKAVNRSIKATKSQIKQIEGTNHTNKSDQLRVRAAKNRLQKYMKLLDKIKSQ